jgi:hypothetical protein
MGRSFVVSTYVGRQYIGIQIHTQVEILESG